MRPHTIGFWSCNFWSCPKRPRRLAETRKGPMPNAAAPHPVVIRSCDPHPLADHTDHTQVYLGLSCTGRRALATAGDREIPLGQKRGAPDAAWISSTFLRNPSAKLVIAAFCAASEVSVAVISNASGLLFCTPTMIGVPVCESLTSAA